MAKSLYFDKEHELNLTKGKFTPQKREKKLSRCELHEVPWTRNFRVFTFSRFRVLTFRVFQHNNGKNVCLSYKIVKIKIKIYNQISFIKTTAIKKSYLKKFKKVFHNVWEFNNFTSLFHYLFYILIITVSKIVIYIYFIFLNNIKFMFSIAKIFCS